MIGLLVPGLSPSAITRAAPVVHHVAVVLLRQQVNASPVHHGLEHREHVVVHQGTRGRAVHLGTELAQVIQERLSSWNQCR